MKTNKSLFKIEYRTSENEGKRIIEAVIPYNSKSVDMGGFKEIITETAFRKTLNDNQNVYAYYNHDDSKVLGSTQSGTLELRSEKDGLYCKILLGSTSFANDLWDVILRGDCKTLSFGFVPFDVENRGNLRYLKSVQLVEISLCVSRPAYEETTSIAYTRNKKKDYTIMKKKNLITRSIDLEAFEEIINSNELITDTEIAQEIINLIDPEILKQLVKSDSAASEDPASEAGPENDTEKEKEEREEKDKISEAEKKDLIKLIDEEIKSVLKENENEKE
jgi:HK97 family phage prohead protease